MTAYAMAIVVNMTTIMTRRMVQNCCQSQFPSLIAPVLLSAEGRRVLPSCKRGDQQADRSRRTCPPQVSVDPRGGSKSVTRDKGASAGRTPRSSHNVCKVYRAERSEGTGSACPNDIAAGNEVLARWRRQVGRIVVRRSWAQGGSPTSVVQ